MKDYFSVLIFLVVGQELPCTNLRRSVLFKFWLGKPFFPAPKNHASEIQILLFHFHQISQICVSNFDCSSEPDSESCTLFYFAIMMTLIHG